MERFDDGGDELNLMLSRLYVVCARLAAALITKKLIDGLPPNLNSKMLPFQA